MKSQKIIGLILVLFLAALGLKAQDTTTVMFYNLLQFPNEKPDRISYLKAIVKETNPDIFMVCELSNNTGSVTILNQALNTNGVNYYQRATFWDDGFLNNMLYYNSRKYKLINQDVINCEPRFATVYEVLHKDALANGDSIGSTFIVVHLKAGSSDVAQREEAAKLIRQYVDTETNGENIFLAGDFNIYSPQEGAFKEFTERGVYKLNDPINESTADWSNNEYYAPIHTQSTRTLSFGGGSTGGMDDRFDWILISDDIVDGRNDVEYVLGSYDAYGNDGKHFNQAINFKENTAVSAEIADALHEMSDHLPVVMKVANTFTNSTYKKEKPRPYSINYNGNLIIRNIEDFSAYELIDLQGRIIEKGAIDRGVHQLNIESLAPGNLFLIKLRGESGIMTLKVKL